LANKSSSISSSSSTNVRHENLLRTCEWTQAATKNDINSLITHTARRQTRKSHLGRVTVVIVNNSSSSQAAF